MLRIENQRIRLFSTLAGGVFCVAGVSGAQPVDDAASAGEGDPPVVNSREDYEALDRDERRVFSRARRPDVSYFVDSRGRWSWGAELDDLDGDLSVARLGAGAGVSFRLDDTTDLTPTAHIWVDSRADWEDALPDTPRFGDNPR